MIAEKNHLILIVTLGLLAGCAGAKLEDEPFPMTEYRLPTQEQVSNGAIFGAASVGLYEDIRAKRVGDIIMVQLAEQTAAQKTANTNITKSSANKITDPILAGATRNPGGGDDTLEFDLSSDHEFSGSGGSNQSNSLTGAIAVTVAAVLPNGNLVVEGEKWVKINRGKEYIRLRGLVRPTDVSLDNVVMSSRVANAEIYYGGKGEVARSNAPGWLSRIFMSQAWPF